MNIKKKRKLFLLDFFDMTYLKSLLFLIFSVSSLDINGYLENRASQLGRYFQYLISSLSRKKYTLKNLDFLTLVGECSGHELDRFKENSSNRQF